MTPWIVTCQASLSMGFSRQEYWTGLSFPSPGDLPDPGIEPSSPALAGGFFTTESLGKLRTLVGKWIFKVLLVRKGLRRKCVWCDREERRPLLHSGRKLSWVLSYSCVENRICKGWIWILLIPSYLCLLFLLACTLILYLCCQFLLIFQSELKYHPLRSLVLLPEVAPWWVRGLSWTDSDGGGLISRHASRLCLWPGLSWSLSRSDSFIYTRVPDVCA